MMIEGTPLPATHKPNFSSTQFLIGPRTGTDDPTRHRLVRNDTYDNTAKLSVRVTTGDQGDFAATTAPMPAGVSLLVLPKRTYGKAI
jgi:hypothetical protein